MESFAAIVFKRSGVANVAAQDIDIDAEVVRLEGLTTFELRQEWVRLYNCQAPQRYARELLIRAITYKMQECGRSFEGAAPQAIASIRNGRRQVRATVGDTRDQTWHARRSRMARGYPFCSRAR